MANVLARLRKIDRFGFLIILSYAGWTAVVCASFNWTMFLIHTELQQTALARGRAATSQDLMYMNWNVTNHGVFVRKQDALPVAVKEFLDHPEIQTQDGDTLVKLDHLSMMLQAYGLTGLMNAKLVSSEPLDSDNQPDDLESFGYRQLKAGNAEYSRFYMDNGDEWFISMGKLLYTKSCLDCHNSPGTTLGSSRGAISIRMPLSLISPFHASRQQELKLTFFWIWTMGMILLSIASYWAQHRLRQIRDYQAELALHNRFISGVIDALPYPFLVVDAHTMRVVMVNEAVKSTGDVVGRLCKDVEIPGFPLSSEGGKGCPAEEVRETKVPVIAEYTYKDASDADAFSEVHAYPVFDENGEVARVIVYYVDATVRKKAGEALLLVEKQAAQLSAVHAAAATYAHEINSPLTGIIGYAELMRDSMQDPKVLWEMAQGILESADRIALVLAKMLEIAKVDYIGYSGGADLIDIHSSEE